jgi:hypothetical protein
VATSYAFTPQLWMFQDHILRDSEVCGMYFDFDNALDGLRDTISAFDYNNFSSEDTVLLKRNVFWRVPFLVKLFMT